MSDEEGPREGAGGTDPADSRRMTRLRLLKAGAAGAAGVAAGGAIVAGAEAADSPKDAPPPALKFLTKWEFDLITAMAETIWPTDDARPGRAGRGRRLLHRRPARRQRGARATGCT